MINDKNLSILDEETESKIDHAIRQAFDTKENKVEGIHFEDLEYIDGSSSMVINIPISGPFIAKDIAERMFSLPRKIDEILEDADQDITPLLKPYPAK